MAVRQAARHLARLLGFEHHDQIRIATAVSELVRAALGEDEQEAVVELLVTRQALPQRLIVRVTSPHLARAADDREPGRGDGLLSAERLLERYDERPERPDTVTLARPLPRGAPIVGPKRVREIRDALEQIDVAVTESYLTELRQQNRELSTTLLELERKQEELTRLNAELADTNRGVMALYAELDERANHLRRADEVKTKFLSNISHEFRTPLNSIRTLAQLLASETDGTLNAEQLRQVQLIHDAAAEMLELVNDLLDLAKVEAGKSTMTVGRFTVDSLFSVLRGMMRPLLRDPGVSLELGANGEVPPIVGDETKVAQVLRNFLSNAVKFTEKGRITVTAEHLLRGAPIPGSDQVAAADSVLFCVADTGIGISRADQELIFEEFTQIPNDLQHVVRGTGLGLSLCRKLAALLGGTVWVESEPGLGSRFYLLIPRLFRPANVRKLEPRTAAGGAAPPDVPEMPLLVVSDIDAHRRRLQDVFEGTVLSAVCLDGAHLSADYLEALRPAAALIDVSPEHPAPRQAAELIAAAGIPLVRIGAEPGDGGECLPFDGDVVDEVFRRCAAASAGRLLVVDDDERFRTVLIGYLRMYCPNATAVGDPRAALEAAKAGAADALVLDLMMPDLDGMTLLTRLREHAPTAALPVLACSSRTLTASERRLLSDLRAPFLPKDALSPETLLRGLVEARAFALSPPRLESLPFGAAR